MKTSSGVGEALLYRDDHNKFAQSWSPDGQSLLYLSLASGSNVQDMWPLTGKDARQLAGPAQAEKRTQAGSRSESPNV